VAAGGGAGAEVYVVMYRMWRDRFGSVVSLCRTVVV
jgi:hypothetical protein